MSTDATLSTTVGLTATATTHLFVGASLVVTVGHATKGMNVRDITLVGSMESDRFAGVVLPDNYPITL